MWQGLSVDECEQLATSWQLALRAERKSPHTLKTYGDGVRLYLAWCSREGVEPMVRSNLNAWTAALLGDGAAATTARTRQLGVRRFAAWLYEESEIVADPFLGIKSPKLDDEVIEPLTVEELRALIKTCQPPRGSTPKVALRYRRDEAIVRFMAETGIRAGEVVTLEIADLDLPNGSAVIRRGTGKGRLVPFGRDVSLALDRYLRSRRVHRLAETPALWLGDRGKRFSNDALHKTLSEHAADAGITDFHPHRLRHTLPTGGSPPAAPSPG